MKWLWIKVNEVVMKAPLCKPNTGQGSFPFLVVLQIEGLAFFVYLASVACEELSTRFVNDIEAGVVIAIVPRFQAEVEPDLYETMPLAGLTLPYGISYVQYQ